MANTSFDLLGDLGGFSTFSRSTRSTIDLICPCAPWFSTELCPSPAVVMLLSPLEN
jgi:hypothetical protein